MRYKETKENNTLPLMVMESSEYSPNQCVFRNDRIGVWLYHANCIEFMDMLISKYPKGKFDMIFADPPYFLSNGGITCHAGKMVKVDKGQWDKSSGPEMNHEFNLAWLSRCQRILKPNGTIWVSGTHHVIHSVGYAMQQLGMKILNDIAWEKPNPPPNLSCRYFTHSTETIIWAAKTEKSKHCFNYDKMREINKGKQMKTVWSFTAPNGEEKAFGKHPTQKPVALLARSILASTNEGDLIFDPFSGSSTTGVAAINTHRKFVGTELESEFINLSIARLKRAIGIR
jgi:site-specific DNA-methyltransferase (adenine-specific)